MIKTKEFAYDDLIMSDSELANIVSDTAAKLTPEEVIDMILRIVKESDEEEPGVLKNAAPIMKITYIGKELYKYGFMVALHLMNESIKESFKE